MIDKELSEREKSLIEKIRQIPYGRVIIYVEKGQPVRIDEVKTSVKL